MWRTLAGGIALALMAIPGPVANAAGTGQAAAGQREKVPTRPRPAKAVKAAATGTAATTADRSLESSQAPALDGNSLPLPREIDDAADSRGSEPARNAPEMLNRGEMLTLARKYSAEIAESLVDGERQRETAVRHKDAIKLACIQDRLSNMKLMKRMADERLASTERPTIRQDELSLRHEFRGVEMAHQRVVELRRELNECVGDSLEVEGPTGGVPASVDPAGSNAEIPRMVRPTPASIFQ
jgi:hypothetical protein